MGGGYKWRGNKKGNQNHELEPYKVHYYIHTNLEGNQGMRSSAWKESGHWLCKNTWHSVLCLSMGVRGEGQNRDGGTTRNISRAREAEPRL